MQSIGYVIEDVLSRIGLHGKKITEDNPQVNEVSSGSIAMKYDDFNAAFCAYPPFYGRADVSSVSIDFPYRTAVDGFKVNFKIRIDRDKDSIDYMVVVDTVYFYNIEGRLFRLPSFDLAEKSRTIELESSLAQPRA